MTQSDATTRLCACGCGGVVKLGNTYLHGHNGKGKHTRTVESICPICKKVFRYYASTPTIHCSSECYGKSLKGRKLPETTIEAMKRGHKDPWNKGLTKTDNFRLMKISLQRTGEGNPSANRPAWNKGLTKETDERMAKLAYPRKLETKSKMSRSMIERIQLEGNNSPSCFKRGWLFLSQLSKNVFYRSSYEKRALLVLDACVDVLDVVAEPFSIAYTLKDGSIHNYLPDFLVSLQDGEQVLVEVKPEIFISDELNQIKFKAASIFAKENNLGFLIWTEKFLFNDNGVTTMSFGVIHEATAANQFIG
jgi:hypothetical protein